ncbi:MAG: hypothetical protein ACLR78_04415 [Roseburia sp.]
MQCEVDGRNREIEYLSRIESQMDRMSSMISEILYENRCSQRRKRILDMALAQISVGDYASNVHIDNGTDFK